MAWLENKIIQVKEYKRLKQQWLEKNRLLDEIREMPCSTIVRFHYNLMHPNIVKEDPIPFGAINWPCILVQQGTENDFWLDMLSGKHELWWNEFHCPNFNENEPCKKCECMHHSSNVQHFKEKRAWDEMIEAQIAMEKAKKRIWHREK